MLSRRAAEAIRSAKLAEQERLRQESERRRREEELRRQRLEEKARAEHGAALAKDLRDMAARWSETAVLRRFIAAAEVAFGDRRTPDVDAWLAWARAFADELDPLAHLESVPKRLDPKVEKPST